METRDKIHVLVVDDEATFRKVLASELRATGYQAAEAASAREALYRLAREKADVVLLDIRLPEMDGLEALAKIREMESPPEVVMLTGHATVDRAVEAMKQGARDFLTKPCPMAEVDAAIQKAFEHLILRRENRMLRSRWPRPSDGDGAVWGSPAMASVAAQVEKVAPTDSTVLLEGESGVGKEVVAQELHRRSLRAEQPFVVVDCTALREELLESELFGHERGAFTGAHAMKHGLFEVADKGTLFLDEITDIPASIQAKLLRVIETRGFRRLGGTRTHVVDVRLVAASQCDLRAAVEEKRFREDLFYRLNVFQIRIPPLRERPEDVPLLAKHFLARQRRRGEAALHMDERAMALMREYTWPGNVRELKNVVERASILAEGSLITAREIAPFTPSSSAEPPQAHEGVLPLRELKKRYFENLLRASGGNKREAARLAGVSERTLHRFVRKDV